MRDQLRVHGHAKTTLQNSNKYNDIKKCNSNPYFYNAALIQIYIYFLLCGAYCNPKCIHKDNMLNCEQKFE